MIERTENKIEGGNETILVVDDEAVILDIAEDILTLYGYSVLRAESGEEALEIFKQNADHIDLILMDLGMPGMGGKRCIEKMLEMDEQTKIIVISGYSDHKLATNPQKYRVKDFISKPYYPKDLLMKIRKVLNSQAKKA